MIRFLAAAALAASSIVVVAAPAFAEIEIQEVTSPGGIDAWLVEEHSIPFVSLEIRFDGGAAVDADGKRGAINLMTGLLEEGAGDMDARAFAQARDDLAASFSFRAYQDAVSVSARFLTETSDEAIDLLHAALVEPTFDDAAVERVRAQVISSLRSALTDPNEIASAEFDRMVYGDHPYATDPDGTVDSVTALTRDDLVAAKDRVLARDRIHVGAAGDVTPEELGEMLDRLFEGLPETGAPLPGPAPTATTAGVTVVPFDTPQSVAFFGHAGIDRDDPDFFPAFVANAIFGGTGRQSRLTDEVREKRGLTYGIGSYVVNYDYADMVLGQFQSANDRVGQAIDIVRDEWARIADEGVTETELEEAKTYLTGEYPLRFDSNASIADILVAMQRQGLPTSYVTDRNSYVEAVTLDDIDRVAKRLYRPDLLRVVVVGQPEGLSAEADAAADAVEGAAEDPAGDAAPGATEETAPEQPATD